MFTNSADSCTKNLHGIQLLHDIDARGKGKNTSAAKKEIDRRTRTRVDTHAQLGNSRNILIPTCVILKTGLLAYTHLCTNAIQEIVHTYPPTSMFAVRVSIKKQNQKKIVPKYKYASKKTLLQLCIIMVQVVAIYAAAN